VTFFKYISNR